jgi:serine/threonine protein kinase
MSPSRCLRCKAEIDPAFRACPHCGEVITEFTRQYTGGNLLDGKYEIVERLGAGGMGQVFKATHKYLGATRVIKVVHPQISDNKDAQDRFLREARAATRVTHPNVATMYDFAALPDGSTYMVSEFIDGENLAQKLRARGTLPPKEALRIIIQTLNGLEAIHRAGIVHRDVSPENVMLTRDGTVKIIDLGVAKVDDVSEVNATRTGIFVGKLRYASPEQLGILNEGEKIDGRADVYAAGMVLYELLMGRPPYEAKSPHEYFLIHTREQEAAIGALPGDMPGSTALQDALKKALARDRNLRFTSARDFAATLEEIERTIPDPRSLPTMALALDGDETMRLKSQAVEIDTLHRETLRTAAPGTPPPPQQQFAAPATILTPLPMPNTPPPTPPPYDPALAAAPSAKMEQGVKPIWVVLFVVLIAFGAVGGGAFLLWPKVKGFLAKKTASITQTQTQTTEPVSIATTATTATEPAKIAEASVNVVTTTSTPPPQITEATATTATIIENKPPVVITPPVIKKRPVQVTETVAPPIKKETREEEPPPPPPVYSGETYVDGSDDSDTNDRALQRARNLLRGVKSVEVHGGALNQVLIEALKDEVPFISIADNASVVIRFNGKIEGIGRGRKVREGHGTVTKNGRVVFSYDLPSETYRVGLPPTHAFARVLSDVFTEE